MKLKDLIEGLTDLVEADGFRADMEVTFGANMEPVEGGIVGKQDGLAVLNLAPVSFSGRPGAF